LRSVTLIDYRYIGHCVLFLFIAELNKSIERKRERERKRKGKRDLTWSFISLSKNKKEKKKKKKEQNSYLCKINVSDIKIFFFLFFLIPVQH